MFKLDTDGTTILMHRGNTGTLRLHLTGYSFGTNDRVYFCMAYPNGTPIKEAICEVDSDGYIEIEFENTDTDYLQAGDYPYAVTAATDPIYDDQGKIVNGSGVSTPRDDMVIRIRNTTALI